MDEPGCDERVLQAGRYALSDAEHDAQQEGRMWRRQRIVERRSEPRTQPRRDRGDARGGFGDLEARRLQLEEHMMLRQVGAPIEGRQVARQCQLAGGKHRVAEARLAGAAPTDQQVADVGDGRRRVDDGARFYQHLGPASNQAAVVCDASCHRDRDAGQAGRPHRGLRVGRWKFGAGDGQQGDGNRKRQQSRAVARLPPVGSTRPLFPGAPWRP